MRAVEEVRNLLTLRAESRGLTKSARNQARRQGYIPAVVYGKNVPATPIMVPGSALRELLKAGGRHRLIRLVGPALDESHTVLIKDLQVIGPTANVTHVDFLEPAPGRPLHVRVPVVVRGEDALTRRGIILEHHLREVDCQCLPEEVPEAIYVDVTHGHPGQHVSLGQLEAPPGVKITGTRDAVVLSIESPMATMIPGEGTAAVTAGE